MGHNVGDAFDVNVTFPEDYHAEELKGKESVSRSTFMRSRSRNCPPWTMSLSKMSTEFDTRMSIRRISRSTYWAA